MLLTERPDTQRLESPPMSPISEAATRFPPNTGQIGSIGGSSADDHLPLKASGKSPRPSAYLPLLRFMRLARLSARVGSR